MTYTTSYVLAIDVETSGCHFKDNALLSIGCSLQNTDTNKEISNLFVALKVPINKHFSEDSKGFWIQNSDIKHLIEKQAIDPKYAMIKFVEYIKDIDNNYLNLTIISDNPSFDIAWIDLYLCQYTERKPLRYSSANNEYRMIWDSSSIQKIWLCIKEKHLNLYKPPRNHLTKLGLETTHTHHPLNDAKIMANRYIETIKQIQNHLQNS